MVTTLQWRHRLDDELNVIRMPNAFLPGIKGFPREPSPNERAENEDLKEFLRPIIGEHYSKWQVEGMGSIYHAKEYLDNQTD